MITKYLMKGLVVLTAPVFLLGVVWQCCRIWFFAGTDYTMTKDVR